MKFDYKEHFFTFLSVATFASMCISMIMLSTIGVYCMTHHGKPSEGDFFKKCVVEIAEEMKLLEDSPHDTEHDRYFKGMLYLDIVRKCGGLYEVDEHL